MNPKIARGAAKIGTGIVGSILIGYLIKAEKYVDQKIEDHFDEQENQDEENA